MQRMRPNFVVMWVVSHLFEFSWADNHVDAIDNFPASSQPFPLVDSVNWLPSRFQLRKTRLAFDSFTNSTGVGPKLCHRFWDCQLLHFLAAFQMVLV